MNIDDLNAMNIDDYSLTREELVVATAIHAYLETLEPEARRETMRGIVHRDGDEHRDDAEHRNGADHTDSTEAVIDDGQLAMLIESAKAAAMESIKAWKDGTGVYQRSLKYIRKELPAVDGESCARNISGELARFVKDCAV